MLVIEQPEGWMVGDAWLAKKDGWNKELVRQCKEFVELEITLAEERGRTIGFADGKYEQYLEMT